MGKSKFSIELCTEICEKVGTGENIMDVLDSDKKRYPSWSNWCAWKREYPEVQTMYMRAREDKSEAVDVQIDRVMQKLEQGLIDPTTARIMIDTLKWKAAKYYPKMFGDKVDVTTNGENINTPPNIEVVVHKS